MNVSDPVANDANRRAQCLHMRLGPTARGTARRQALRTIGIQCFNGNIPAGIAGMALMILQVSLHRTVAVEDCAGLTTTP